MWRGLMFVGSTVGPYREALGVGIWLAGRRNSGKWFRLGICQWSTGDRTGLQKDCGVWSPERMIVRRPLYHIGEF